MRLSVHLMVLNGAMVLDRLLVPLRGAVDEVVYVDTGSTDASPHVIASICAACDMEWRGVSIDPVSRPDLYFVDEPGAYRRSQCLAPHTGRPLLRDWAAARNLGLDECRGDYVLKLDADDEVVYPESILPVLSALDAQPEIDFLMAPYQVMSGAEVERTEMYTRLWRRRPDIRFQGACHENVDWCRRPGNWTMAASGLLFRDHRDSPGQGARPAHRNLRVLLREYERLEYLGERPTAQLCMYLADEAADVCPDLADEVLDRWIRDLAPNLPPSDRAWYHLIQGRVDQLLDWPGRALVEFDLSASLGWPRAELLAAIIASELGREDAAARLTSAIARNREGYYPMAATRSDLEHARRLATLDNGA